MFRKVLVAVLAVVGTAAAASVVIAMGSVGRENPPPSQPAAVTAPTSRTTEEAFAECVGGGPEKIPESRAKAAAIVNACAEAIQSHKLTLAELTQARLNRGAARVALDDQSFSSQDFLEALRHYEGAIDPLNPDALQLYRAGAALEGIGQDEAAANKYSEAIKADRTLALAYYGRGVLLATRKRSYARAIGDFGKVLALEPANVDALLRRGDAYSQVGDFGHAIADLNRAIELDPPNSIAFVVRGLIYDRGGRTALALDDYATALELNPRNAAALRNRGALHARLGQFTDAIADFDAVIAMQPKDALAFFDRGYANFGKHQYELAAIDYGTAIFLEPTMGQAYLNRGLTRTIQGKDLVEALADCDQAIKLLPLSIVARETRGFIYLKLGDAAIAAKEYEAGLQIDANRPLALYGLGLAKIRMGRTSEGQADQAAALALNPAIASEFSTYGVE